MHQIGEKPQVTCLSFDETGQLAPSPGRPGAAASNRGLACGDAPDERMWCKVLRSAGAWWEALAGDTLTWVLGASVHRVHDSGVH
jgi:hypothetical protein